MRNNARPELPKRDDLLLKYAKYRMSWHVKRGVCPETLEELGMFLAWPFEGLVFRHKQPEEEDLYIYIALFRKETKAGMASQKPVWSGIKRTPIFKIGIRKEDVFSAVFIDYTLIEEMLKYAKQIQEEFKDCRTDLNSYTQSRKHDVKTYLFRQGGDSSTKTAIDAAVIEE